MAFLSLLLLFLVACPSVAHAQDVIRVTGKVISKEKRTPLMGVNVVEARASRLLATTDEDGRFAINVHSDATLRLTMVGADPVTLKVKGRNYIEVEMNEEAIELGEATVSVKRIRDKVMPEPTTIEIVGNWFIVKTRVRVPREMFSGDTRLVVQPIINNVTRKKLILMKPMVYDAREYNTTQSRLYDFELKHRDPLADYITVKSDSLREKGRKNDIIGYRDSVYIDNMKDEYTCDVYMAIEDYNHIRYRDTTIIARGTVNPLRFLDYAFAGGIVRDSAYLPKPELQLRDSKGEINLRFPIGKSSLDMRDEQNASEMSKLNSQLQAIASSKDATLRSFSIVGTASPDGRYSSNLRLAGERMRMALNHIVGQLNEETRRNMKVSSHATVAGWDEVAKALRKDSLFDEAEVLENIIGRYSNRDEQSRRIRRLSFYKNLLEAKYLPRLRRVGYEMNYSIFRFLTIDEIKALYQKDYRQLSRYEFFRLYREEPDTARRAAIIHQALEIYPSFAVAASDLQEMLIERKTPDPDLLTPFAGKKAPTTLNINHMIALLDAGRYATADSIAEFVPETDETILLKSVAGALNGRYADNFDVVSSTGLRNKILMLLAMKRNDEALKLCTSLPDDEALTYYIRAICYNRGEKPVEAFDALKKALKMDPSLEKTAWLDGDVNDLILDKKRNQ